MGVGILPTATVARQGSGHFPIYLNTPEFTAVFTLVGYILLVLTCEAYIGVQSLFKNGYAIVWSPPIVNTT